MDAFLELTNKRILKNKTTYIAKIRMRGKIFQVGKITETEDSIVFEKNVRGEKYVFKKFDAWTIPLPVVQYFERITKKTKTYKYNTEEGTRILKHDNFIWKKGYILNYNEGFLAVPRKWWNREG